MQNKNPEIRRLELWNEHMLSTNLNPLTKLLLPR